MRAAERTLLSGDVLVAGAVAIGSAPPGIGDVRNELSDDVLGAFSAHGFTDRPLIQGWRLFAFTAKLAVTPDN